MIRARTAFMELAGLEGSGLSQVELQQEVQRFACCFADRLVEAGGPIYDDGASPHQEAMLRRVLLLLTAVFDIAAAPVPEVNLLDMLTCVTLCRDVFENHWVPNVFGDAGRPVLEALDQSLSELWAASAKVLTTQQQEQLREVIRDWQARNPGRLRVEGVRLAEFSEVAVGIADQKAVSGLMASVRAATRAADGALLLGERAMFLAPRVPMLLRLHGRLALRELLEESVRVLQATPGLPGALSELQRALPEVSQLLEKAGETARDARALSEATQPLASAVERLLAPQQAAAGEAARDNRVIELARTSLHLSESAHGLLGEATRLLPASSRGVSGSRSPLERLVRKVALWALLVGLVWTAVFWGGYVLFVRSG